MQVMKGFESKSMHVVDPDNLTPDHPATVLVRRDRENAVEMVIEDEFGGQACLPLDVASAVSLAIDMLVADHGGVEMPTVLHEEEGDDE